MNNTKTLCWTVILIASFLGFVPTSNGQTGQTFAFAAYYESNMVLQGYPHRAVVWGYATASDIGSTVFLTITNGFMFRKYNTTVKRDSVNNIAVWKITTDPIIMSRPVAIVASLKSYQDLLLQNVVFGDVWFCSGQDNMEQELSQIFNATEEAANAETGFQSLYIRYFSVGQVQSRTPLIDVSDIAIHWSYPNRSTILQFSAVCWLFAKYLYQQRGVSVGMVESAWGGTEIEAWSSPDSLKSCGFNTVRFSNQTHMENSTLWNAMVYPFLQMTIYGVLWYQGEANVNYDMNSYNCILPAMVRDWRMKWYGRTDKQTNSSFPFGIVQLGPTSGPQQIAGFPDIRWHQTADVGYLPNRFMPNTFMAVTYDLADAGGGVLFRDKQTVSQRLVLSALAIAYPGYTSQRYMGPLITNITLDTVNYLLILQYDNGNQPIVVNSNDGFEVCCQNVWNLCSLSGDDWLPVNISAWTNTTVSLSLAACRRQYVTGIRFAWRATPCPYKRATVASVENALPAPPYIIRRSLGRLYLRRRR